MLRSAFDQFTHHVGNVNLLQGETPEERELLYDGVMECLEAAEDELSTIQQEKLLRSAQFGKCFLDGVEEMKEAQQSQDTQPAQSTQSQDTQPAQPTQSQDTQPAQPTQSQDTQEGEKAEARDPAEIVRRFQEVCHTLRVLNMLRDPSVGSLASSHTQIAMFLTCRQYSFLGPHSIIDHLLCRRKYYLAIKICQYLSIPPDFVLISWACQKVRHAGELSDEAVRDQIRDNLKNYSSISYRGIASVAFGVGRTRLATMLLEFEPRRADRVGAGGVGDA